ncbi:hypothetical protein, partial [Aquimarina litoralis]|uniref:hypothetical protein n=1 Tax=Aquimarina litoralis TaxID=584605 RepID=UPI001C59E2EE
MKNTTLQTILVLLWFISLTHAQELILKQNEQIYSKKFNDKNSTLKHNITTLHSIPQIDRIARNSNDISNKFEASPNYDFFQGLQSPFHPDIWIYMEREQIGGAFRLHKINLKTNSRTTLLAKANKERKDKALKPIAWTNDPTKILVEELYLDAAEEHEGIFIYDIETKESQKIHLPFQYTKTPLLSPKRNKLIFSGSTQSKIDYLHGISDIVYEYDIDSKENTVIFKTKGKHIDIVGWKINSKTSKQQYTNNKSALSYYLPWDFGKENCVSRHGTPGPTGSHSPVGQCGYFTPGGH